MKITVSGYAKISGKTPQGIRKAIRTGRFEKYLKGVEQIENFKSETGKNFYILTFNKEKYYES